MNGTEENGLVERCRGGEDEAWRELVDRYSPKIYSIAYHFTLKRDAGLFDFVNDLRNQLLRGVVFSWINGGSDTEQSRIARRIRKR